MRCIPGGRGKDCRARWAQRAARAGRPSERGESAWEVSPPSASLSGGQLKGKRLPARERPIIGGTGPGGAERNAAGGARQPLGADDAAGGGRAGRLLLGGGAAETGGGGSHAAAAAAAGGMRAQVGSSFQLTGVPAEGAQAAGGRDACRCPQEGR